MIQNDTESPRTTSGLRIGFAALTTRGCTNEDAVSLANIIYYYLNGDIDKESAKEKVNLILSHLKNIETV